MTARLPGASHRAVATFRVRWSRRALCCGGTATGAITGVRACDAALPMITEWELWSCANHYIRQHGEDAPIVAAMRADELLAQGDLEGSRTFQSIVRRINQLLEAPSGALN